MISQKPSILYRTIQSFQDEQPWGTVLDAGTGRNSLRWMTGLDTDAWTAVTGSKSVAASLRELVQDRSRPSDRMLFGNWADRNFLKDEVFDTVMADYLLGSIEGFAPYFQSYLFERLRSLTAKTLYVTGLEPYVPQVCPEAEDAQIIWEIGRFRDACVLLKGGLPYREYPSQWVIDQLARADFKVDRVKHFNIGYKQLFVTAQIDIALSGLDRIAAPTLIKALKQRGKTLRAKALAKIEEDGALRGCKNYVIKARPI